MKTFEQFEVNTSIEWFKACNSCNKNKVDELIESGIDINQLDIYGQICLISSLRNTHNIEFSKYLYDKGCDPLKQKKEDTYYDLLTRISINNINNITKTKEVIKYISYLIEDGYDINDVSRTTNQDIINTFLHKPQVTSAYFITTNDSKIWMSEEVQESILQYQPYNVDFYLKHTDNGEGGFYFSDKLKNKYKYIFMNIETGLL